MRHQGHKSWQQGPFSTISYLSEPMIGDSRTLMAQLSSR